MAKVMEAIFRCCAGFDVHSEIVAVCVRRLNDQGEIHAEVRTFNTMTRDLLALCDWLLAEGVTHVAMESTGVFWKPIYNILEGQFEILLVNARHVQIASTQGPHRVAQNSITMALPFKASRLL